MPKIIRYTLTTEELQHIQTALTSDSDGKVRSRAQAVYLLHLGNTRDEVAKAFCVTPATIANWHKKWREGGIENLKNKDRSGRPPKGGDAFLIKLEEVINTDPKQLDYGFTVWTIQRLIEHMRKVTNVTVSEGTMFKRLQTLNFVYRRPKHDLGNLQDKEAKKQAEDLILELKKRQSQAKSNYSLWTKQP